MKNTKNITYGFLFVFVCMFIAGMIISEKIKKEDPFKKNANNKRDSNIAQFLTIIGLVGMIGVVLYIAVNMSRKKHYRGLSSMKSKRNIGFKFY
jgi:beta-lactamase regulating signal transducer with metallopeptidase domain